MEKEKKDKKEINVAPEKKDKPVKKLKINKKFKLGLALGGGGALGIAHIGALKAFEELGINFDYIAGTSVGSLVGALYCYGFTVDKLEEIARDLKIKDLRTSYFIFKPSSTVGIQNFLIKHFGGDIEFKDLKKKLVVVSTDLKTGKEVHLDSGKVSLAVAGSCAVPGVFAPVEYNDMNLVDGGLKNNLPSDVVRNMGANIVFAVELNYSRGYGTEKKGMFDVIKSSVGIIMASGVEPKLAAADIVIQPDMREFARLKLDKFDKRFKLGYDSVMASRKEIQKVLSVGPNKEKEKNAKKI